MAKKPLFTVIGLMMMALALSACTEVGLAGEGLSVLGTKKTLGDHIVSIASGKDCSTIRSRRGEHYCKEDEPKAEATVTCYRTLGRVSCYEQPQKTFTTQRPVGDNDHNLQHLAE